MKFTTPIFAAAATLIAGAAAELYITLPDEDTVWVAGQPGYIAWNTTAAEFGLMCDIQLIDVATTEAVMNITNQSIPCSISQFNTTPLPVMENEEFMIRIGETNNQTIWSYTQNFKIVGGGAQNDGNATIPLGNSTSFDNGDEANNDAEEQKPEEEKKEEQKPEEEEKKEEQKPEEEEKKEEQKPEEEEKKEEQKPEEEEKKEKKDKKKNKKKHKDEEEASKDEE